MLQAGFSLGLGEGGVFILTPPNAVQEKMGDAGESRAVISTHAELLYSRSIGETATTPLSPLHRGTPGKREHPSAPPPDPA